MKTSVLGSSQDFRLIWMECGVLLRPIGVRNPILLLPWPFNIQGKEPYLCGFVKKKFNIGLYSDIYRSISFKLGMKIETTNLTRVYILIYITISLDDLDLH